MKWRYSLIIFIFIAIYLALISNIYNIQLNKSAYFSSRVISQSRASGVLEPQRGNIYFTDKNNNLIPAALNKDFNIVFAVSEEIQKAIDEGVAVMEDYTEKLVNILNKPEGEIIRQLSKKGDLYELLLQKAAGEQVAAIQDFDLKGIYVDKQKLRFYPFGALASHLIGYVSSVDEKEFAKYGDIQMGRYGLESHFNSLLVGQPGEIDKDRIIEPEAGKDLKLTIDRNIQSQIQESLVKLIEKWSAAGGTIIVQEPASGKILAMASYPDFDPNNYSKYEMKNFLNPATQAIYEPGSVFKIITMAAGIDSGKISSKMTYVDTGSITLNGKTIRNWDLKSYGKQTMTNVIEHSINTGTVYAERKIGHNIFYNYLVKFGFNELTNINLPSEVRGNIKNLKAGRDIDFATASFGQGVSVTPIGLINAVSAIANGGVLMKPLILADEKQEVIRRVISKEAAQAVSEMMVSAVKKNVLAEVPNYKVAGKTGTAFIPDFEKGGYTDEVINSYVGFAPATNPAFAILIKLEKPKGSPLAGQTVVPVFQELAQFILNYYNIAPDNIVNRD